MWQNFSLFPYRLISYVNDLFALQNVLENSSSESFLKKTFCTNKLIWLSLYLEKWQEHFNPIKDFSGLLMDGKGAKRSPSLKSLKYTL